VCESCVVAGCCFYLGLYQIVVLSAWFFARRKNWTGRRIEEKNKSRSVRQLLKDLSSSWESAWESHTLQQFW
jgi:hypothetical protein